MIKFLTLTGADDTVQPSTLLSISKQFPFVEWGILYSPRNGKPRFPSNVWFSDLIDAYWQSKDQGISFNLSLHLCGDYVKNIIEKGRVEFEFDLEEIDLCLPDIFNRIQINTHGEDYDWNLSSINSILRSNKDTKFIFQYDGNQINQSIMKALATENPNVCLLFDQSHGAGKFNGQWNAPFLPKTPVGYAGGLGPNNLADAMESIAFVVHGYPEVEYWVDMETKIRSKSKEWDVFDINKVNEVIQIVKPWFEKKDVHQTVGIEMMKGKTIIESNPEKGNWVKDAQKDPVWQGPSEYPEFKVINKVAEFHKLFEHPILPLPGIPSHDRCTLRENLIDEELGELSEAIANQDIVGIADALADLNYVIIGAVLEFGLQDYFKAIMEEVHRSNMSKACQTKEEALETQHRYITSSKEPHHIIERGGLYFVYRTRDMKTVKSVGYSPANLFPILHEPLPPIQNNS